MIKYEWRTELDTDERDQVRDLLHRAAAYDSEPEYSTIAPSDVERALTSSDHRFRHLLIWMLPYGKAMGQADQPERIAGIMRLAHGEDGIAQATIVIDPRLRSIGITTLLLERVGLDATGPGGWFGTGAHTVTAWAQGNHPAAGRLSNRFRILRTRRVWKLVRSTASSEGATAAPVLEPISAATMGETQSWLGPAGTDDLLGLREDGRLTGAVHMSCQPIECDQFGPCAMITMASSPPATPVGHRRRLLDGAAAVAHEAGLSGVIMYVDSDDARWVNACRMTGFQHDRTDVRFQLGGER